MNTIKSAEEIITKYPWHGFDRSRTEKNCLKAMKEYADQLQSNEGLKISKPELIEFITALGENCGNEKKMEWYHGLISDIEIAWPNRATDELTVDDYKEIIEDNNRLLRELDVLINGENAAKQASLCDIVSQLKTQQPTKSVVVVCAICGKCIKETGTSYNNKPVHIGCYHKAEKVHQPIKSVPDCIKLLKESVEYAEKEGENMEAKSWGMQEGMLISYNDAKNIVAMFEAKHGQPIKSDAVGDEMTVGSILQKAIKFHELNPEVIESELNFPKGVISKLMNDEYYINSVPIILFKNLILSLHISFDEIEAAMIPTFNLLRSKETNETISKKPHGYELWENEESLNKYTKRLKELMTQPIAVCDAPDLAIPIKDLKERVYKIAKKHAIIRDEQLEMNILQHLIDYYETK